MKKRILLLIGALLITTSRGEAQKEPPQKAEDPVFKKSQEDPIHHELRALFQKMLKAYNEGDFDELVTHLDENVVITWQNAVVSKTPAGVKEYFDEMLGGPDRRVQKVAIKPVVDELTHLYGDDAGVAFGSSEDYYLLKDGMEFRQETRWSATVVKRKGEWKVASVHISTNMFDNPILDLAIRRTALWTGVLVGAPALLVGGLLAAWIGRIRRKRTTGTANGPA